MTIEQQNRTFNIALRETLGIEGGYSDDESDRGGKTNYGITEAVARDFGYTGRMEDLPVITVRQIYRANYWDWPRLQCGAISEYSEQLAMELFDTGVNMGVDAAAKFLQIAMNALNYEYRSKGIIFGEIEVDGWVGDKTIQGLNKLTHEMDKSVLVKMCDCLQGVRYLGIMLPSDMLDTVLDSLRGDRTQKKYARGWFDKRVFQTFKGGN